MASSLTDRLLTLRAQLRAASTPTDRWNTATALLNVLGQLAAAAPTPADRDRWLAQYRELQQAKGELVGQIDDGAPGAVLRSLDQFSDGVLGFADGVATSTVGIIKATATAIPWLPVVAGVVALVVLLYFFRKRR